MSQAKLSTQEVCQALMREVREAIHGNTQRQVDVLQYDARDRLESDSGKHILALAGLPFTEQQLTALEAAFREAQEDVIGWLFALIDGSRQPPGWASRAPTDKERYGHSHWPGNAQVGVWTGAGSLSRPIGPGYERLTGPNAEHTVVRRSASFPAQGR
ncbi:hypothetical protein [Roseiflexus sp. RS-1]|uniref:hypothetical protein n=1 Tax=Roseiflexus sp. (strain RS-1) TaxID=357808 RepID=UPI0000D81FA6|nr:hypothetical protein [Roseiflexus sp. RS-1]ABQ90708.1 hypothetical protein RoseRS_2329 [Roseiflexus sp. RS-1]